MRYFLLFIIIVLSKSVLGQDDTSIIIKPGQSVSDVMTTKEMYRYPQFKKGTVSFVDGRNSVAMLNYNMLYGEMEFIGPGNDTMALAEEATLKWIIIEQDTFYFDEGYLMQIASHDTKMIAQRMDWQIVRMDKVGAFDQPVFAGADAYGVLDDKRSLKIQVRETITLQLKPYYYIAHRRKFFPLTKKNIMRVYPKYDKIISAYLEQEQVDFNKKVDVLKLFNYLKTIDR